ncbi:pyridoxamine 5'-phosphate oxidase family protein [Promicromonospora sp. NPDC023805]|uniref:pyridoxamine 5'-phosphate oxidase family protein n=1 Tax=Promicromonospora sp. NPDC023805 TaxID=3154696 RepID=UPI0033D6F5A4
MDDPITAIDTRFSEPDAEPTSWQATQEVLENAQMTWVTTVRADGRPHVAPLAFGKGTFSHTRHVPRPA